MANKDDVKNIIEDAVAAGIAAGWNKSAESAKDAYKETERRLYALPILKLRVKRNKDELEELRTIGSKERDKSIVRMQRPGYRMSPEDALEMKIQDIESQIATDEYEISIMTTAMETFRDDPFYLTVPGKYIDRITDDEIAAELDCSASNIWKQRLRLVKDISVLIYGSSAV